MALRYWTEWYKAYEIMCKEWNDGCQTMREHQIRWNRRGKKYHIGSEQVNMYFYEHAMRMNEEKTRRDAWILDSGRKTA